MNIYSRNPDFFYKKDVDVNKHFFTSGQHFGYCGCDECTPKNKSFANTHMFMYYIPYSRERNAWIKIEYKRINKAKRVVSKYDRKTDWRWL